MADAKQTLRARGPRTGGPIWGGGGDNASETYFPENDPTKSGQTMPQNRSTERDALKCDIPVAHMFRSDRMIETRIRYARHNIGTSNRGISTFKIVISAHTTAVVGDSKAGEGSQTVGAECQTAGAEDPTAGA